MPYQVKFTKKTELGIPPVSASIEDLNEIRNFAQSDDAMRSMYDNEAVHVPEALIRLGLVIVNQVVVPHC